MFALPVRKVQTVNNPEAGILILGSAGALHNFISSGNLNKSSTLLPNALLRAVSWNEMF